MLLNFAGQLHDDGEGGGGVPDDLTAGALAYADHLEATGERCTPGDAEKVGWNLPATQVLMAAGTCSWAQHSVPADAI